MAPLVQSSAPSTGLLAPPSIDSNTAANGLPDGKKDIRLSHDLF